MASTSGTSIWIPLPDTLSNRLRAFQATIPNEVVYREFPMESDLFANLTTDRRDRFGLASNLHITVAEDLPKKASFCTLTRILSSWSSLKYSIGELSVLHNPWKSYDELVLSICSQDIHDLHRQLESAFLKNDEWFSPSIRLAFLKKKLSVGNWNLDSDGEFDASDIQIAYPMEVVRYNLKGVNPWMIDQPLPENPELLL